MKSEGDRAVLVTGTSGGIGRALATRLDGAGYRVFAGVRRAGDAEALGREASDRLTPLILDITDAGQIADAVAAIGRALGPDRGLAAVVNNAGMAVGGPLEFVPPADLRLILEVNYVGQIALLQACMPLLRRGRGRVVQVSSAARLFPMPFNGAYTASKAAIGAATDTLRREFRAWGIPVTEVLPGLVLTPIWGKFRAQADSVQNAMPAHAAGQAAAFARGRVLLEKAARYVTSAETVARRIQGVLEARRPPAHRVVGLDARLAVLACRFVPTRVLDWFVAIAFR